MNQQTNARQVGQQDVDYSLVEHVIYHADGRFTTFTLPLVNLPETQKVVDRHWPTS